MSRTVSVAFLFAATIGAQGNPGWAPPATPRPGYDGGLVYDSARQRLVLYGGYKPYAPTTTYHDLWEWEGTGWLWRRPPVSPSAWEGVGMAYDSARQRVVLFGGRIITRSISMRMTNETWEWDGFEWVNLTPAVSPAARANHAVAYDEARQRVVLFGGTTNISTGGGEQADTWEWDGTAWTRLEPAQSPAKREDHAMVYDRARGTVVLFGGHDPSAFAPRLEYDDTWEWDGTNWTLRNPATKPLSRRKHSVAYDASRQRVVLFGGFSNATGGRSALRDTWEWDGTTWTSPSPSGGPTTLIDFPMTYDEGRQRTVLFGGWDPQGSGGVQGDMWEWDGTTWTRRLQVPAEPPATGADLVYDQARQRTILFGAGETWELDGSPWRKLTPPVSPPARSSFGMVWDSARQRVLLFGGGSLFTAFGDTWEWDGTTWSQRFPAASPLARAGAGLAYDETRQRAVLFGGTNVYPGNPFRDTWEWNGTTWTRRNPTNSPARRAYTAMAWDPDRGRVVLFGGLNGRAANGDTWEWDGTDWTNRSPAVSPRARAYHAMTWDAVRRRVVLFGGTIASTSGYLYAPGTYFGDTWEWDGTFWTQTATEGPRPLARQEPGMAFDGTLQRTVMYGGVGAGLSYTGPGGVPGRTVYGTWMYTDALASNQPYGAGCEGSSGMPRLGGFGAAILGRSGFALDLVSARPASPAVALLATGAASLPLAGDCALLVDLAGPWIALPGLTGSAGTASFPLPLPATASLGGQTLWSQAVIVDPLGPWQGLTFSGGLAVTLGL